jgi:hypothetical protein
MKGIIHYANVTFCMLQILQADPPANNYASVPAATTASIATYYCAYHPSFPLIANAKTQNENSGKNGNALRLLALNHRRDDITIQNSGKNGNSARIFAHTHAPSTTTRSTGKIDLGAHDAIPATSPAMIPAIIPATSPAISPAPHNPSLPSPRNWVPGTGRTVRRAAPN